MEESTEGAAVGLARRVDEFRSVRAAIERSILPLATSLDGRRFSFQAAVDGLALQLGSYVMLEGDGSRALGQVQGLELVEAEVGELASSTDEPGSQDIRARMSIRLARGEGVVLERSVAPFHNRLARPATPAEVSRWLLAEAAARSSLHVGGLSFADGVPATLDAGGFDRHTFLCGQSGSGKSYSLGLVLEQLLLETDLRIVVLDPNGDFVRLAEVRPEADAESATRWSALASAIGVRAASAHGEARLRLRFGELAPATQAALLHLDPVADREEYAELASLLEARPETLGELMAADRASARALRLRLGNLRVEDWGVWAREQGGSVTDALDDPRLRCLVIDVGSLDEREEQTLAAETVLRALWDRRHARRPVLLVIDEAHNVCPAAPADALTALATDHVVRIAGEGRKYGIYLLVATQRPQKVHENVTSQCDNLLLMRVNSAADGAFIADRFGFAPPTLVGLATGFGLGEALVAGKVSSHPAVLRFGSRVAREGGGDVDGSWARPDPR